jgi:hypothetical protein
MIFQKDKILTGNCFFYPKIANFYDKLTFLKVALKDFYANFVCCFTFLKNKINRNDFQIRNLSENDFLSFVCLKNLCDLFIIFSIFEFNENKSYLLFTLIDV